MIHVQSAIVGFFLGNSFASLIRKDYQWFAAYLCMAGFLYLLIK